MKTVLEFGVRGGQFAESIVLSSQKVGAQMAANLVRVFSNNQQHTFADQKQWRVAKDLPRRSWTSSSHFVALSIMDDVPRGPASAQLWKKDNVTL